MSENDWLTERFEQNRPHLRAVAYRMLGSLSEAEDAVQECWLRLNRADTTRVENLGGWLSTVVARVSLDMLRSRKSRREEPFGELAELAELGERPARAVGTFGVDPEREALLADSVGPALLVILETLGPAERLAFVLHDRFAVPFDEIAPIVGRSVAAVRQLASRARHRVQGTTAGGGADAARERAVVAAFLAASRNGDFDALITMLDPDVVLRADSASVAAGARDAVRGAPAVAQTFSGRARAARLALVDGAAGAVWAPNGRPRVVFAFTITSGKIVEIELVAESGSLREIDLVILGD